jgi:predicted DNA-binding transcriptional regulator AlpA
MKNPTPSDIDLDAPARHMAASGRRLVTEPEAAAYLRVSRSFLAKKRCTGGGPRFCKIGRRVLYDIADLDAYADQAKRRSTSDFAAA